MRIYKYPLKITDIQTVRMPKGAKILSVQEQHGKVCVWALVDPDERIVDKTILIIGTGNPIDDIDLDDYYFLNTVQSGGEPLIWHVFVKI